MQEEVKKKSVLAGIPYTVIIFVFVATLPSLISDTITRTEVNTAKNEIINAKIQSQVSPTPRITIAPTVTATPSAALRRSVTPVKTFYTPTTGVKK